MDHILNMLEPSKATIGGVEVPLLFNMRAAAMMEKELDTPYPQIISEILGEGKEGQDLKSIPWERQAKFISCMIRAGGMEIMAEELMAAVHMTEAQKLANAAIAEMVRKQPKGKPAAEKNG